VSGSRERLDAAVLELEEVVAELESRHDADEQTAALVARVSELSGRISELIPAAMRERLERP
jgi:hypothetical protein